MRFNFAAPRPLLSLGLLWAALHAGANNIQVSNATLTGNTGTSVQIQFDLSWENSWRGGAVTNWDAAWVFVKYRTADGVWRHANLNNTGHVPATGSQIDLGLLTPGTAYNATTNPVVGVFIYRNASGTGNLNLPGTLLQWNFAALGLNYSEIAQVQVFAIEMVYVPQGAFAAGSGGAENSRFTLTTINTGTASTAPAGTGSLGGQAGGYPAGAIAPNSASWPNGFNAFYVMKYEVSQQQYVDFLNTLTYAQQITRTSTATTSAAGTGALSGTNEYRNGIDIQISGLVIQVSGGGNVEIPAVYACNLNGNGVYGENTDGKETACNFLSWGDLTAYLDWSGLRPMTELEFEKACRGTAAPLADGFPWGTANVAFNSYNLANAGAGNEGIATNYSTTVGNAAYILTIPILDVINGPLRVGVFAANGSNNGRETAGSSYYGIMELGGNVWERPVTIANSEGRAFTGVHGNGVLAANGDPDAPNWPSADTAQGAGRRGGSWSESSNRMRVSDRQLAQTTINFRGIDTGGRGVRLSP